MYALHEVDGVSCADTIHSINRKCPDVFPELEPRHFENGYWWLVCSKEHISDDNDPSRAIAFAGLVPFEPFSGVGYFKRCYVLPDHHGHGLQYRLMIVRELKARTLGWGMLVSECGADNHFSSANFRKAGFEQCEPEQKWGAPNSIYWRKTL